MKKFILVLFLVLSLIFFGCTILKSKSPEYGTFNDPVYILNSDKVTVSDNSNGLMWQVNSNGMVINWQEAIDYCDLLSVGGFTDWRLPNKEEIVLLYNYSEKKWFGDPFKFHISLWTNASTEGESATYVAYYFGSDGKFHTLDKVFKNDAKCVRSK